MDKGAFREELRKILSSYSKQYQEIGNVLVEKIIVRIDAGTDVTKAIDQALKESKFYTANKAAVADAIYFAACAGYGILPQLVAKPEGIKNKLFSDSWTPDKMSLSSRLHSGAVRQRITDTVAASLRNVDGVRELSKKLYDGYHSGKTVITAPKLPQYLETIVTRASMAGAGGEYIKKLQGDIGVLLKETSKLKSPELKAAYRQLLNTCMSAELKQSVVKKAAWVAVQEKARYISERIARTEASRAWYDGFIAENQDNEEVWGYRWMLSSRHSKVPFDQCDVCANMDVGFGKGVYPKNKVPNIPRHPHCMCMLEVVYIWEIDKTAKFNPDGARQYIDGLDDKKKTMLFGYDGLDEYRKGAEWQKLLRGWHGFGKPVSRLSKAEFKDPVGDAYQIYTKEQIQHMAAGMQKIAAKYTENESKWSGKVVLSENGLEAKLWNCDIALRFETCNHLILHEQLHAHSASYHEKPVYRMNKNMEEASVQFFNQEISKRENIAVLESGYDNMVAKLRYINRKTSILENDFDFAKVLFHVPLPDRLHWLYGVVYEKMMQKGKIEDLEELNNILDGFEEDLFL